jgi:hypothetical protein
LIDFVEPPPTVKHSLDDTPKLWPLVPVQPAPEKPVIVADIAREAEARRAVAMKTMLNCIMVRWRSF